MSVCRSIRFSASAGTGKTHQVVNLYLALLLGRPYPATDTSLPGLPRGAVFDGRVQVPPERIVMLTFTRNAAAEMRSRITEALEEELSRSPPEDQPAYWSLLRRLPGAVIATLHSFAQQLLAQHTLRLGLAPALTILEEDPATDLLDRVVQDTLRACLRSSDRTWVTNLERLCEGQGVKAIAAGVKAVLYKANLRGLVLRADDLAELVPLPCPPTVQDLKQIRTATAEFVAQAQSKVAEGLLRDLGDALRRLTADAEPDAVAACARALRSGTTRAWGKGPEAAAQRQTIQSRLDALAAYAEQGEAALLLRALIRLASECSAVYERAKREQGALDFDDLLIKARDLVRDNPRVVPPLDVVIVDEAQDNSYVQNEFIGHVQQSAGAALVVCGDRKQSIYAWRGADPAGLDALARALKLDPVPLKTSYRSQEGLLNWINAIFGATVFGPEAYGADERLEPCAAAQDTPGPNVQILLPDWELLPAPTEPIAVPKRSADKTRDAATTSKPRLRLTRQDLARLAAAEEEHMNGALAWQAAAAQAGRAEALEARAVARRIKLLTAVPGDPAWQPSRIWNARTQGWERGGKTSHRYRDILILLRATSRQELYESALKEAGIPFTTDGKGRGFFFRQEVQDVVNLLAALASPLDDLALLSLLRSPFFALSDDAVSLLAVADDARRPLRGSALRAAVLGPAAAGAQTLDAADLPQDAERYRRAHRTLARLRSLAGRVSAVELAREAVRLTGYDAILAGTFHGVQRLANLRKLLTWIQNRERREDLDLQGLARALQLQVDEERQEPDAAVLDPLNDSVRINTVHAAKGLSSPVVFVPDLRRTTPAGADWVLLGGATAQGPATFTAKLKAVAAASDEPTDLATAGFTEQKDSVAAEREAEARRLFYVACTRARDLLVFSGENPNVDRGADRWRDWLNIHLLAGGGAPALMQARAYGAVQAARLPPGRTDPAASELRPEWLAGADAAVPKPPPREIYRFPVTLLAKAPSAHASNDPEAQRAARAAYLRDSLAGLATVQSASRNELNAAAADEPAPAPDDGADTDSRAFGALAHHVLETLDYWSGPSLDEQIRNAPELAGLSAAERQAAGARLRSVAAVIGQMLAGVPREQVLRELPFCARFEHDGAQVIVDGKIDLLYRGADAWHIIDYKFASTAPDELIHRYGFQLAIYREAVADPVEGTSRRQPRFAGGRGDAAEFRMVILRAGSQSGVRAVAVPEADAREVPQRLIAAARFVRRVAGLA